MQFICTEQCELPFMLNLPSGDYEADVQGAAYVLGIHQENVALHFGTQRFAVGDPTWLKSQLGSTYDQAFKQRLRTVVRHCSVIEVDQFDLPVVTESDAFEEVQSEIISESPMTHDGNAAELHREAQRRLDQLSREEILEFLLRTAKRRAARKIPNTDRFLSAVNVLIRLYMQQFNDVFVEEVTLHQLAAQSPLMGVFVTVECDGEALHQYGCVGKIAPIMRNRWLLHPQEQVDSFREALKRGDAPDSVALLEVRARAFLERGATRSAIIEGSAALELAISIKLREGFARQGMVASDIDKALKAEIHFKERSNKLMFQAHGKRVADVDNALYVAVLTHRDNYRHGIAHADVEPTQQEADQAIQDFERLRKVVDAI